MSFTLGQALRVTLFGESHGPCVGAVLDGLPAGIPVDAADIQKDLDRRRPTGEWMTQRREADVPEFLGGLYQGKTDGTPLTVLLRNRDVNDDAYTETDIPRPGHADYTAAIKYGGYNDPRGGGAFSGRMTAPLVALGAVAKKFLTDKNVRIYSRLVSVGPVTDDTVCSTEEDYDALRHAQWPVASQETLSAMKSAVKEVKEAGDSLGGVIECVAFGLPVGVGEPFFDSVESVLSHALFSLPAVKGVSFGDGFALTSLRGSEANDAFAVKDGRIVTLTNHAGGILGGITDGMPLRVCIGVKPTPTVFLPQTSVCLSTMQPAQKIGAGRHDPCIALRMPVIAEAMTALALSDLLLQKR